MFEQAFRNIDDILRKEAGCTTELDHTEQTSWLLFLKYLDGLEQDRATEAKLEGKKYTTKSDCTHVDQFRPAASHPRATAWSCFRARRGPGAARSRP
jgi:hypothetical protein